MKYVKRFKTLDEQLPTMDVAELQDELSFWRAHAATLWNLAHKLAMKRVHEIEHVIELSLRDRNK